MESTDDHLGTVTSHRISGEGYSSRYCFNLALDEDGHTASRVLSLRGMVDGHTMTEGGGEDALHGSHQGLCPAHVEDCLILPGE